MVSHAHTGSRDLACCTTVARLRTPLQAKCSNSGLPPVTFGGLPVHFCPFDYAFELLDVDDDEDEELRALYSCSPRNDTPTTKPFAEGVALIPLMEQAAG